MSAEKENAVVVASPSLKAAAAPAVQGVKRARSSSTSRVQTKIGAVHVLQSASDVRASLAAIAKHSTAAAVFLVHGGGAASVGLLTQFAEHPVTAQCAVPLFAVDARALPEAVSLLQLGERTEQQRGAHAAFVSSLAAASEGDKENVKVPEDAEAPPAVDFAADDGSRAVLVLAMFAAARDAAAAPAKVLEKQLEVVGQLHSAALLPPVYSPADVLREARAALLRDADGTGSSHTLLYLGAAWCPPCLRILLSLPELLASRPPAIRACFKADWDSANALFVALGVATIPTFVIVDNRKLAAAATEDGDAKSQAAALAAAVVASVQNSQRATIETFLQKHSATLSFTLTGEEDF